MNKAIIIGRMCADPELKMTGTGKSVSTFTVAVNRQNKETDFVDCVAWEKTAEFICKWFAKGSPIVIEGAIQTRTYEDKDGGKRKAVEINVKNAEFAPKGAGANAEGQEASFAPLSRNLPPLMQNAVQSRTAAAETKPDVWEQVDMSDEDIPF